MLKNLPKSAVQYRIKEISKLLAEADKGDYRHIATVGQYAELDSERRRLMAAIEGK